MAQLDLELCFRVAFVAVLLPLTSGACVDLNLGVGSGTIPDSDITASTEQSAGSPATNGRLNYTSGSSWCAETSDTNPYLQIDLKSLHIICAVSTQGNSQADQWVKNYTLQISSDETTWTDYKEGGQVKFLRGNDDRNSEVKHVVYGVLTRFLRFLPQTHQGGVCMRLEVFGVEKASTCESEDIGLASGGTIPDSSFSASSYYNSNYKPSFGRLNGANRGWSPKTKTNLADFLQIDLLYEYVICAVATQGANGISEWTTNYKTQLSMDGITPVTYQETNVDKVFPGNSNQNGIVKNNLREFSSAKFIRFQPTTYHSWKSLRVEVYGVLLTKVPSQPPTAFNLTASSSTSITASWQLPPIFARHGRNITGFKLFYREKCFSGSFSFLNITSESTLSRLVTGLQKYTEYEFQVLAYSSDGDGPKSPVKVERTQGDGCVQNDLGMEGRNIPDSRITASSSRTPAENGRLNYVLGAPWCAETNDTSPYLQIDLQTLHIICAVSTQGNSKADQWVKNYTLQISTDGTTWTDYMEGGQVKFMRGNNDRNSEVKHFVYGVLTRYMRFLPQMHQTGVCMRTEVFGVEQKPRCYMEAIGVASSDTIPDSSFSALSEFNSVYAAKYGRLNGARSWAPMGINNANDYLQIDLLFEYVICAVATQGNPRASEWTTKYKLRLALEDPKFVTYQENSADKVFAGNSDQNSVVKNSLQEFASAKFIRLQPTAFSGYKGLRVEVYGILLTKVLSQPPTAFNLTASSSTSITASWQLPPIFARHGRDITGFKLFYREKCFARCFSFLNITSGSTLSRLVTGLQKYTEYEFQVLAYTSDGDGPRSPVVVERTQGDDCVQSDLGMEGGNIQDSRITASSFSTSTANGRLNYALGASWCAETNDTSPYLQIDLQTLHVICAVSTQGNSQADQWVRNYTLQISTDGTTWTDYMEGGQVKFLRGNDDRSSEVKHVVYGLLTRYLRFLPQIHQGGVCMRTEVFGVKQKPRCYMEAIGVASSDTIPDSSFSALSEFNSVYAAKYGRLNGARSWAPMGINNANDYLQIDLLFEYVICAVATQGNPRTIEWTTKYKLRLAIEDTKFVTYQENSTDKVFAGNSDQNSVVKNSLQEFASAKFIRFQPTAFSGYKGLRVEVYGILLTKVPSQPPTAFNLTATSSISITASWQLPPIFARHGRNITGFKLFYRKKDLAGCFSFLNITSGSTLSRHVTGLEKYTEYKFQVLAYTSEGDGPKGSVEVERTMEDAPSRPPSNFYVTATSSTTVTASWQLPSVDSRNGIIKGFKVFYKRKDSAGPGIILTINGGSTFKKNVTGLNKYTEYEFQVLAFTSVGDGPYSSMVVERTNEDVPSQPPGNFTSTASTSTSITASWQLPPADSRNGVITGYKLFYKKRGISRPASMQPINNQATHTQEVTELNKFTEYEFQILAFTYVGDGPKSTTIFEKTKEAAPSGPPSQFNVTVNSSTSIIASWHLPPEESRHGIIIGYKLFYKEKDSGFGTFLTINNGKTSKRVINLDEYTEYEFQVLAFTSAGNGPNTSSVFTKTMEDAPSAPTSLAVVDVPPSNLHGPRITLSWSKPTELNGVIRGYNLFYSHGGGAPKGIPVMDKDTLRHTVDVLGGMTYRFHVRAVTVKPGVNGTITVTTKEYEPSVGPDSLFSSQLNKTTFNISWEPLQNEMSYGRVILYEVRADVWWTAHFHNWFAPNNLTANTSETFVVLFDLMVCSKYNVSVRAYTGAGPGPYSEPLELVTSSQTPGEFRATSYGTTHVTLTWKHSERKELVTYTVNYNGTKFYDKSFKHVGAQKTNSTTHAVRGLFPGTSYKFEIYGSSDCGKTANKSVYITTHIMAPNSPLPLNMTDVEVSGTAVDIYLWPVEQENGPISAYQVIVLKVVDGVEELPGDYGSQLKAASDAKKDYFDFYIAAEIENVPVIEKPWKFTVGDSEKTANYKNEILESGENYIVYERALTKTKDVILEGKASKVAKITISPGDCGKQGGEGGK